MCVPCAHLLLRELDHHHKLALGREEARPEHIAEAAAIGRVGHVRVGRRLLALLGGDERRAGEHDVDAITARDLRRREKAREGERR